MKLSEQQILAIARALRDAKPIRIADNDPRLQPWTNCVVELMRLCAESNRRFKRDLFLDDANCSKANI
jgi:hypothetical protein